jgi:hypothetical protein
VCGPCGQRHCLVAGSPDSTHHEGAAKEYFDWRFLLALIVFIALLFAHAALFGVGAFPDGWVP